MSAAAVLKRGNMSSLSQKHITDMTSLKLSFFRNSLTAAGDVSMFI